MQDFLKQRGVFGFGFNGALAEQLPDGAALAAGVGDRLALVDDALEQDGPGEVAEGFDRFFLESRPFHGAAEEEDDFRLACALGLDLGERSYSNLGAAEIDAAGLDGEDGEVGALSDRLGFLSEAGRSIDDEGGLVGDRGQLGEQLLGGGEDAAGQVRLEILVPIR